jgi:hypothetical protein
MNGLDPLLADPQHNLKIMIVSTQKTGNTWLRLMLAAIYDLPTVELPYSFDVDIANGFGERWILQQHLSPEPDLLEWAERNNVIFITTIRHPGDVLISLYHYVRSFSDRINFYELAVLNEDDGSFGAPVREILRTRFKDILAVSTDWMATGKTHIVRYEPLYVDPVSVLMELTNAIAPVSRDQIERAIERTDMPVMRALIPHQRAFFRKGGSGGWREVLPDDIVEILRTTEPYPSQLAAMGYTLDAQDPWSDAVPTRPPSKSTFLERAGHSGPALLMLKAIYLSYPSEEAERRWPDATTAPAPTSFHRWLAAPAEADNTPHDGLPDLTNFALRLRGMQPELCATFYDVYGQHRLLYLFWILEKGIELYQFDETLVGPIRKQLLDWCTRPDPGDPAGRALADGAAADVPVLTNLALYLYRQRPDLQAAFPDVYGQHRLEIVFWLIGAAIAEHRLDPAWVAPLRRAFTEWAARPAAADPARQRAGGAGLPILTNLAMFVYQQRPDLRAAFPDVYGRHRLDFILWLIDHAAPEYQLDDDSVAPLREGFLSWAMQPSTNGEQRLRTIYLSRFLLRRKQLEQTPAGRFIRAVAALRVP